MRYQSILGKMKDYEKRRGKKKNITMGKKQMKINEGEVIITR